MEGIVERLSPIFNTFYKDITATIGFLYDDRSVEKEEEMKPSS